MKKRVILAVLISMLILPTFGIATEIFPEAEMKTLLYVNPQRINAVVNEMVSIEVRIANAVNLYAYDFKFRYDNTILNCLDALIPPGHFLESPNTFKVKDGEIHQDEGSVWFAATLLGEEEPKTGSGILGTITFQVISEGWCVLNLSDAMLLNGSFEQCQFSIENGYFAATGYSDIVIHDVAIIEAKLSALEVVAGDSVEITVTAKNEGTETETFDVKVFYNDTLIGIKSIDNLAPKAQKELIFNWETTNVAPSNYLIRAEASIVPGETEITDNTYFAGELMILAPVWETTDLNQDGIVDIVDLLIVAQVFGKKSGDLGWISRADLDKNGLIDIFDLIEVAKNFGKTA